MLPTINPFGTQNITNLLGLGEEGTASSLLTTTQVLVNGGEQSLHVNEPRVPEYQIPQRVIKPKTYERILSDKRQQFGQAAVLTHINSTPIMLQRKESGKAGGPRIPVKNAPGLQSGASIARHV